MRDDKFYLGRLYDTSNKKSLPTSLEYDPVDLTTHAVVTGMTGSGKTGLCITLLEEAALQGIPALVIDTKGDLTNLLLHFPELAPQDFQPWIDPETARRTGKTIEQAATEASLSWRDGLQKWGIGYDRLVALDEAAQFAVFTPGSDAGIPVSVLSSLATPNIPWDDNREILREKIASTVTALLGLVGMTDIDPLQSREHILLANIFEQVWSQNKSLDLNELILQTQNPPFDKLGAFPVDTFFPAKERTSLAMQLNNILAAPAFEIWREGQALDIESLLFMPDNRPRHSVFYLAHLSDTERMFFITLLLASLETWMREQAGSGSLRAILYMDELFGYLPPQRNPPSKQPLLRMLKQARAFGLGLLLATQNPVDLDYKALSNAGTWFIGKLQTERDKERLLDGLESAGGGISRSAFDKLISKLGKRVFLMNNVHDSQPAQFKSRWAMNFLAGPMTRNQIPALNRLVGADKMPVLFNEHISSDLDKTVLGISAETGSATPAPNLDSFSAKPLRSQMGSDTRPPIPSGIAEYFLPTNLSLTEAMRDSGYSLPDGQVAGILYKASILASANVRFLDRKYHVDTEVSRATLVLDPDKRGVVRWEDHFFNNFPVGEIENSPAPQSRFSTLDAPMNDSRRMKALENDFSDWLYRTMTVTARANVALKIYVGPDISQADFIKACAEAAREARDAEIQKKKKQFESKIATIEDRLAREERELDEDEAELAHRKLEEMGTHFENIFGGRSRSRRRISTSLSKRRMTKQAKADVEESKDAIAEYQRQITALEEDMAQTIQQINDRWGDVVNDVEELQIRPAKSNIYIDLFGVAWMPYYMVESGGRMFELPAFGREE